jgi:hypothetical protein
MPPAAVRPARLWDWFYSERPPPLPGPTPDASARLWQALPCGTVPGTTAGHLRCTAPNQQAWYTRTPSGHEANVPDCILRLHLTAKLVKCSQVVLAAAAANSSASWHAMLPALKLHHCMRETYGAT